MSDICTVKKSTLDGIAEAIQSKTGESGRMLPGEMRGKIEDIISPDAFSIMLTDWQKSSNNQYAEPYGIEFLGSWQRIPGYFFSGITNSRGLLLKNITEYQIPEGVTVIDVGAFGSNSRVKKVVLPHTTLYFNTEAFSGCTSLENINLEETLIRNMQGSALRNTKLTSLTFPTTFATEGQQGFSGSNVCANNGSLTTVIFLGNPPTIANNTFNGCTAVELYDFSHATAIPSLYSVVSLGHASGCVIRIPSALSDQTLGTGNGWESATNWSGLTNIVWEVV